MLQVEIIGRLGANAEVKSVDGQKFVSFNVAHTERWTDEQQNQRENVIWVSCSWNGDGGKLLPYLTAGTLIYARGNCSLRVYSSQKDRCMKAGLNLHVRQIELVGQRQDEVPRQLVTSDGILVQVNKAYYVNPKIAKANPVLNDTKFNVYNVDKHGFVFPKKEETTPVTSE